MNIEIGDELVCIKRINFRTEVKDPVKKIVYDSINEYTKNTHYMDRIRHQYEDQRSSEGVIYPGTRLVIEGIDGDYLNVNFLSGEIQGHIHHLSGPDSYPWTKNVTKKGIVGNNFYLGKINGFNKNEPVLNSFKKTGNKYKWEVGDIIFQKIDESGIFPDRSSIAGYSWKEKIKEVKLRITNIKNYGSIEVYDYSENCHRTISAREFHSISRSKKHNLTTCNYNLSNLDASLSFLFVFIFVCSVIFVTASK